MNYTAFDFELADNRFDSACAGGFLLVRGGEIVRRRRILIKPPRPPLPFHVSLHGLDARRLVHQPDFEQHWPEIRMAFRGADFVCSHGANDPSILRQCCEMIGAKIPRYRFLNTVRLVRDVWGLYPSKLRRVCRFLEIPHRPHDPLSDAEACAWIVALAGADNVRRYFLKYGQSHEFERPQARFASRSCHRNGDDLLR